MLITGIKVGKLYGLHNYDMHFSEEECVKIIHAPNGYGKTTILKLIKAILLLELQEIKRVPFESFSLTFEQDLTLQVTKKGQQILYTFSDWEEEYEVGGHEVSLQEKLVTRLKQINEQMPICLIDAQRLWQEQQRYQKAEYDFLPTVRIYAKELSQCMKEALEQAHFKGQALDASFPTRLTKYLMDKEATYMAQEAICEALQQLEQKRERLKEVGLFTTEFMPDSQCYVSSDPQILKTLTLYIKDSQQKLEPLEALAAKISILSELVNEHFSYKQMEVNTKDGFVFKVPTDEVLKADQLSSGEQNELILMFTLLFKAPAHALVLMDEPEISLHIAWQQSFLEDMTRISQLSQIRMMIATHSPDIINGRWDLTTGLEEEE